MSNFTWPAACVTFFVFQNLYQNTLNLFEDTLLILVSKDLYKLQILKVK